MTRPKWWPDWVPQECAQKHKLLPGAVRLAFRTCRCRPSSRGHEMFYCATCYQEFWPPEHNPDHAEPAQRIIL